MSDRSYMTQSGRFSPLRYPGGKGKLARYIASVIETNSLSDGTYVEPYAGGAAIAWELLLTGVVRRVEINDISRSIYSFWQSALFRTDELCRMISDCRVDVETWDRCKASFQRANDEEELALGFSVFFLNRTNRSGILNGGIIGGRAQTGAWAIDARFNKTQLVERIERIAMARSRITVSNQDAVQFLARRSPEWGRKTLVYLDPPYYVKGGQLYYDSYKPEDHAAVAAAVRLLDRSPWIVSYDDVPPIHDLYGSERWLRYAIGYSARERAVGLEAMFFSRSLQVPAVAASMIEIARGGPDSEVHPRTVP